MERQPLDTALAGLGLGDFASSSAAAIARVPDHFACTSRRRKINREPLSSDSVIDRNRTAIREEYDLQVKCIALAEKCFRSVRILFRSDEITRAPAGNKVKQIYRVSQRCGEETSREADLSLHAASIRSLLNPAIGRREGGGGGARGRGTRGNDFPRFNFVASPTRHLSQNRHKSCAPPRSPPPPAPETNAVRLERTGRKFREFIKNKTSRRESSLPWETNYPFLIRARGSGNKLRAAHFNYVDNAYFCGRLTEGIAARATIQTKINIGTRERMRVN